MVAVKCPVCHQPARERAKCETLADTVFGTYRRWRQCPNGCPQFQTTEMDSAQLGELRRKAYLYERLTTS